jgi:hypothetical protein
LKHHCRYFNALEIGISVVTVKATYKRHSRLPSQTSRVI